MSRLQRTASTAQRGSQWWNHLPYATGALAIGVQAVMSVAMLFGGVRSDVAAVGALVFAAISLGVRNPVVVALPGVLTVVGASITFGAGWSSVPVLGAFGFGSWVVMYLAERTKERRRHNYVEPIATKTDVLAVGGIAGVSAVLVAVVFIMTLLPELPLGFTAPAALLAAAAAIVGVGTSVSHTRKDAVGNEEYFRVGTALEPRAKSIRQVGLRSEPVTELEKAQKQQISSAFERYDEPDSP